MNCGEDRSKIEGKVMSLIGLIGNFGASLSECTCQNSHVGSRGNEHVSFWEGKRESGQRVDKVGSTGQFMADRSIPIPGEQ